MDAAELLDDAVLAGVVQACHSSPQPPVFRIRDLLGLSDEQRGALIFRVLGRLDGPYEVRTRDEKRFNNIFDAALHVSEGADDVRRCDNGLRAVLEAAAVVYPQRLDVACEMIRSRFQELGVAGLLPQSLLAQAKHELDKATSKRNAAN